MAWHVQAVQSTCQPQNKEAMLSTALGFPTAVIDHCSILVSTAISFSQELLPP